LNGHFAFLVFFVKVGLDFGEEVGFVDVGFEGGEGDVFGTTVEMGRLGWGRFVAVCMIHVE
jgi:hypothetical protein